MHDNMRRQNIISRHPYKIFQGKGKDKRFRTSLPDKTKPEGRRPISRQTLEELHDVIVSEYRKHEATVSLANMNLENVYEQWIIWRRDNGTDPNTIKDNRNDWNKVIEPSELSQLKMRDITIADLENFFLSITKNHAITSKRLSNIRSVLSGIFKYAVREKIIERSILFDIDFKQFRTRCKPSNSNKAIYSVDERKAIFDYLEDKTDIYSLAISFAFRMCLRIGELAAIKKDDINEDSLSIGRSTRRRQTLNDDLTMSNIYYDIDERVKGNATEGIREVNLTPKARDTVQKVIDLYPDGEYLFMRWDKPILADTFNEHLKRICTKLGITYRSSHQIRFTTATNAIEAGVPINQLSHDLGHTELRTTMNYVRTRKMDNNSKAIMARIQDI